MTKPLTELSDLHAEEVSLVGKGANKKKPFPIHKQEIKMEMEEILKAVLDTELDEETSDDFTAWVEKAKLSEKGTNAVKGALRLLAGYKDELPPDVLSKLASVAGYPAPKQAKKQEGEEETEEEKKAKKQKEEEEELKAKKQKEEEEEEGGMSKDVKKQFELISKAHDEQIKSLKDQHEAIQKKLDEERDERRLGEWVKKAETELAHCPGKSFEEMGTLLKQLEDVDPKLAEAQFTQMRETSKALASSELFSEAGSSFRSVSKSDGAWDQIEKLAEGLVEKSSDIDFTREDAVARVLKSQRGQELYSQYLTEHPSQTGRN